MDARWLGVLLAVVTATALWLVRDLVVIAAFIAGALAFLAALWRPRAATYGVGAAAIAMLVLRPVIGWVMARYGGFLLPREGDDLVGIWRDVTYSLPSHLLQGFGFDSSRRSSAATSGVILGSPRNAALQIWLELGLVGVALAVRGDRPGRPSPSSDIDDEGAARGSRSLRQRAA